MAWRYSAIVLLAACVADATGCTGAGSANDASTEEVIEAGPFGAFDGPISLGEQSPGEVTLQLVVDPARSFCDQTGNCRPIPVHIVFLTTDGAPVGVSRTIPCDETPPACHQVCQAPRNTCVTSLCIDTAQPFVGQVTTWDGTYQEEAPCGNTTCLRSRFVPAGHYLAQMCASPGTAAPSDAGQATTCLAVGPQECVTVPFDLPGPSPVVGQLPGQ